HTNGVLDGIEDRIPEDPGYTAENTASSTSSLWHTFILRRIIHRQRIRAWIGSSGHALDIDFDLFLGLLRRKCQLAESDMVGPAIIGRRAERPANHKTIRQE